MITEDKEYINWKGECSSITLERAIRAMPDYSGLSFDHWVISPCSSYFDCGDDTSFGIYAADAEGNEGDFIFIGENEWECYCVADDLLGIENVRRGKPYRYIWK